MIAVSRKMRGIIETALITWSKFTCLHFEEAISRDVHFLNFRSDREGCFSFLGKRLTAIFSGNDVNLSDECDNVSKY